MPLLNWLDKDEATKASAKSAYRLLEERSDLSHGDTETKIATSSFQLQN